MEQEGEKRREQKRQRVQQQQPQFPQQQQQRQKCPRCDSINTKFCYFNNYSLSQPRHYCKTCKRYWTQGGTFRNIPVGGASRKVNKRSKTISSSNLLTQQPQQNLLRPSPSAPLAPIVHSSTTPYYNNNNNNNNLGSGSGFYNFSFRSMMNTSSQPNNFSQYLKLGGGDVNDVAGSCSSNSPSLVSGFNAAYSSRPPRFQQQRLVATNMASGSGAGAVSHSAGYYRPQSLINNNNIVSTSTTTNHRASDASFWNAATINNVSGNSDQNNVKRGSSSSSPNHHWLHRPGFGPSP